MRFLIFVFTRPNFVYFWHFPLSWLSIYKYWQLKVENAEVLFNKVYASTFKPNVGLQTVVNSQVVRQIYTLWVKKQGTTILSITSPNVNRFSNFFTDRFISKYATRLSLTIPPHLKAVAELPCETSVSENSENLMHASLSTTNHKVV